MTFFFFFSYFQDRVQLSSQRDGFCFMKYSFMTGLGSNHRQTPLQLCHVGKGSWSTHIVPVQTALHAKEKRTCKQHDTIGFLGLYYWPWSLYLIYISLDASCPISNIRAIFLEPVSADEARSLGCSENLKSPQLKINYCYLMYLLCLIPRF